jgi:hypothetical protein
LLNGVLRRVMDGFQEEHDPWLEFAPLGGGEHQVDVALAMLLDIGTQVKSGRIEPRMSE